MSLPFISNDSVLTGISGDFRDDGVGKNGAV